MVSEEGLLKVTKRPCWLYAACVLVHSCLKPSKLVIMIISCGSKFNRTIMCCGHSLFTGSISTDLNICRYQAHSWNASDNLPNKTRRHFPFATGSQNFLLVMSRLNRSAPAFGGTRAKSLPEFPQNKNKRNHGNLESRQKPCFDAAAISVSSSTKKE